MKFDEYLNASKNIDYILSQTLSVESVTTVLQYIKQISNDDECAHGWEKDLWQAALKSDDRAVREKALESLKIEFSRWFA